MPRWPQFALFPAVALLGLPSAPADTVRLKNGGIVEGDIVERGEKEISVRTSIGIVKLAADSVERIEVTEPVRVQYARRAAALPDTADDNVALADWCAENGLTAERRKHLLRAIAIDPQHENARSALGHVKVNGIWVAATTQPARAAASKPTASARAEQDDNELIAEIQSTWSMRIRAIRDTLLDGGLADLVARGRAKLEEIRDPLAVLPMVRALSPGGTACRAALVGALKHFDTDETTVNLAAIALLDAEDSIREEAVRELVRRADPRVGPQIRRGLKSQNDELVRRAAIALGRLRDPGSIPDLIDVLTAQRVKRVEVVASYFDNYVQTFSNPSDISLGDNKLLHYRGQLGVSYITLPGAVPIPRTELRLADVTVFRTEVMEALKAITGQNFGFEAAEWRRWYEEHGQ